LSIYTGFFDAVESGGEFDRVYSAEDFARYFSLFIGNGVFPNPSSGLQVVAQASPNMNVSVSAGDGWINGYYIRLDASEMLTIPTAPSSLNRIDSVIMGLDYTNRQIALYIRSGAVSANPTPVVLQRDSSVYELELAQILVNESVASILQSNITDMRPNSARCGIVSGTVSQIDTTGLFAQYNEAFSEWFETLQDELSGDVATNLQNQINSIKLKTALFTLSPSNWNSTAPPFTQTVSITGILASESGQLVTVAPTVASRDNWDSGVIICTGQASGSLTFESYADQAPSVSIQGYASYQEVI